MYPLNNSQIQSVFNFLDSNPTINIGSFILTLLGDKYKDHHITHNVIEAIGQVLPLLPFSSINQQSFQTIQHWSYDSVVAQLQEEMYLITAKQSGFHFSAKNTTENKLKEFNIQEMSHKIQTLAPNLWRLIESLSRSESRMAYKRQWARDKASAQVPSYEDEMIEPNEIILADPDDDLPEGLEDDVKEQNSRLKTIKQFVSLSILMQSSNRSCNALQSALGIFLHSCNAPETIRELLAHMGLSISTTSINEAIHNLSREAATEIEKVGQSLMACYAYDNLDINLKHSTPNIENPQETLIHITSGTLFPLNHGVTLDDLRVSDDLWKKSQFNPDIGPHDIPSPSLDDLLELHAETDTHPTGLFRRERFNSWKFLSDLINYGPDYFRQFRKHLGDPEVIDAIPIVKTRQIPLQCVDVSPSTPAQNAEVLDSFCTQTGIGDPKDTPGALPAYNVGIPLAGDLLTCQHIRSLQESRAPEATPWRRLQGHFFIMGLFHLKMACADALWRILIHPKEARMDPTSLMAYIGQIRPKETGKIEKDPGFRRMHEVIQHVGIASRLDIWRIEAQLEAKKTQLETQWKTLDDFAASKPDWNTLCAMANRIAVKYVASDLNDIRHLPDSRRDKVYENALVTQQYFLLYEEISHAMNHGDIGRVESCMIPWMMIFTACGKHKYATEIRRYLENVHFIFPSSLSRAIRMNILCNPTGRKGHFRALDWMVEHNNLYIKRIYGGKYSNHQKSRILEESPLIETYKNIRLQFEQMFCLEHKTSRHSPPRMTATFKKLTTYMEKEHAHGFIETRTPIYSIAYMIEKGAHTMMLRTSTDSTDTLMDTEDVNDEWEALPDEVGEVEDDGSLDAL